MKKDSGWVMAPEIFLTARYFLNAVCVYVNWVRILLNLNKVERQTLVIVTHDEKIAASSSRIIHIRDGKLEN